jgi:double-stranded uracil-DNA glycosylase
LIRKESFNAVVDDRTNIVILGSLPGDKSLEAKQYYAHPTNQFWRLLGGVIERDLTELVYADRIEAILKSRVGLWDVIASAGREGSLDSDIRDVQINRLQELHDRVPSLKAIAFNGATSAKIGRRQLLASPNVAAIDLPSSSAGYCSVSFDWKQHRWNQLKTYF